MMTILDERLKFARALRSRPFAMVWVGQTISNIGDNIFMIALAWQVLLMTKSGLAMGIIGVSAMVPRLIFTLLGGVTADRLPRKLIILWSDGGRGLIVLLITILGLSGLLQFWQLVAEALIFGVVDGFFNPAVLAIIPDLAEKEDLASANSLSSIGGTLAQLIGPALGSTLIAFTTTMGAFFANALSYLISFAFLFSVSIPERHMQRNAETEEQKRSDEIARSLILEQSESVGGAMLEHDGVVDTLAIERASEAKAANVETQSQSKGVIDTTPEKLPWYRTIARDIQEGFVVMRQSRWLWVITVSASAGNIGFTAVFVAMPKLVHDSYHQGAWLLGLIEAVGAIGSLISLPLIAKVTEFKKRSLFAQLAMIVTCMGMLLFGLPFTIAHAPFIAPLASAMIGFGLVFFNTIFFTILQEIVPADKLGRVISLDTLGSFAMIPIGNLLGGYMADRLGPPSVFIIFGIINLVIVIIPLFVKEIRDTP